jgi:hypothetical protein
MDIERFLSLLGDQYEHLPHIARETLRSLDEERAACFNSLLNDWLDVLTAIHEVYSEAELRDSLLYLYFNGLFKEMYWFQLLFLGGNYPLLHRSLRYVWEMIFRACYVDTYVQESPNDPQPPGPLIDDKVEWLAQREKGGMFRWNQFMKPVLGRLLPKAKDTEIEAYYKSLWNKLNEYVHPSKALLDRMVVGVPGSLVTDIFDKEWALETVETATMVFDVVWLAVFFRFPECMEALAQKGLRLGYPLVTVALRNLSVD